jgi:hypothetical protein
MGQRKGVFSLGELRQLVKRSIKLNERCGCGKFFVECDTWTAILDVFRQKQSLERFLELDATMRSSLHYFFPYLFSNRRKEYRAVIKDLIDAIVQVTGCTHIVDSSKTGYFASLVYKELDYEVQYIMLYRNPLGTINSMGKVRDRFEHNPKNPSSLRTMRQTGVLASSFLWSLRSAESILHGFRFKNSLLIKYDDLGAPYLESFYNENFPNKLKAVQEHHSLSGNPSRFNSDFLEFQPDLSYRKKSLTWRLFTTLLVSPVKLLYVILFSSKYNLENQKK